jgi:ketosteroid isomerase-like protein
MRTLLTLFTGLALSLGAAACKKEEKSKDDSEQAGTTAQPTGEPAQDPEAKPDDKQGPAASAQDRLQAYEGCWTAVSAKDWEKYARCFSEDAVTEFIDSGSPPAKGRDEIVARGPKVLADAMPDLTSKPQVIIHNGDKVASIVFSAGTHTAPLKGDDGGELPPTNKKVGIYGFHMGQFAPDKAELVKDWHLIDTTSLLGQLGVLKGPHRPASDKPMNAETVVVTARNDEVEKKNLAAFKKAYEAFGKRDTKAMFDFWADDAKMMSTGTPGEQNKKQSQAFLKQMLKGFPDAKGELVDAWAAGDYVVAVSRNTGTNTGPMPAMQIKKATGKSIEFTEVSVIKMKDGKAVQGISFLNNMALAGQLGLGQPAGDAPPAGGSEEGDQKAGG